MKPLNQCAQCAHGVSESVIPMAGHAGDVVVFGGMERRRGGVMQGRGGADGGEVHMLAGSLIRVDVLSLTPRLRAPNEGLMSV